MSAELDAITSNTWKYEVDHSIFCMHPGRMCPYVVILRLFHVPETDALSHRYQYLVYSRDQLADPPSTVQGHLSGANFLHLVLCLDFQSHQLRVVGDRQDLSVFIQVDTLGYLQVLEDSPHVPFGHYDAGFCVQEDSPGHGDSGSRGKLLSDLLDGELFDVFRGVGHLLVLQIGFFIFNKGQERIGNDKSVVELLLEFGPVPLNRLKREVSVEGVGVSASDDPDLRVRASLRMIEVILFNECTFRLRVEHGEVEGGGPSHDACPDHHKIINFSHLLSIFDTLISKSKTILSNSGMVDLSQHSLQPGIYLLVQSVDPAYLVHHLLLIESQVRKILYSCLF